MSRKPCRWRTRVGWRSLRNALAERFPSHVVCAWLGNSEDIAKKHYYQVTDDHFAQGATGSTTTGEPSPAAAEATSEPDGQAAAAESASGADPPDDPDAPPNP